MDTKYFGNIIDFHVHPYLDKAHNLCMYTEDDFALDTAAAKADLERSGISKICGSVICKEVPQEGFSFAHMQAINDHAVALKKVYGDFYEPGFHIHPAFVKESLETIEWMHQNGYRLIGELVPYYHHWSGYEMDYGSKAFQEILELANEYRMILNYHTMPSWMDRMDETIAAFPNLTFVAAHPGQKAEMYRHIETLKKFDNVYLDISGTGLFRYGMLREGIYKVGAEKLIFGTDYPITNPGMYVQAVCFEQISDDSKEKIFSGNAKRIFGWT